MFTILYRVVGHGVNWGIKVERRIEKRQRFLVDIYLLLL